MNRPSVSIMLNTLVLLFALASYSQALVYVLPAKGMGCPTNTSQDMCCSINDLGRQSLALSNKKIIFLEGTHTLEEALTFNDLYNIAFQGLGSMEQGFHESVRQSTVIIRCTSSGGLAFKSGSVVTFKDITITDCGSSLKHNHSSLSFDRVDNIVIERVSIQNSTGKALYVKTNTSNLTVTNSSFSTNNLLNSSQNSSIHIQLIDPSQVSEQHKPNKGQILIANTNVTFGVGSGLYLHMNHSSYDVSIIFRSVIAHNQTKENIVIDVPEVSYPYYNIVLEHVISTHSIGGLYIKTRSERIEHFTNFTKDTSRSSSIVISNSKFNNNTGNLAYGAVIISSSVGLNPDLLIKSTQFNSNKADYGYGLYLVQDTFNKYWNVTLVNVALNGNVLKRTSASSSLFAYGVFNLTLANVSIANNVATGILAYDSAVRFADHSATRIYNNEDVRGGALALYGGAMITLGQYTQVFITDNHAEYGGGIYIDSNPLYFINTCFYQFADELSVQTASVTFSGNSASAGSVIFGGSIERCYTPLVTLQSLNNVTTRVFKFHTQRGLSVISSAPVALCFCKGGVPDCSMTNETTSAAPGEEVTVSVAIVGQMDGIVPGTVQLKETNSTYKMTYATAPQACSIIKFPLKTRATSNTTFDIKNFDRKIKLHVNIDNCPPGFEVASGTCDCSTFIKNISDVSCDINNHTINRPANASSWTGITNGAVIAGKCPKNYCTPEQVNFTLLDSDSQCASNRTGILCGACQEGLSLTFGSNECIKCSNNSIALIILFAVAGLALVALLMLLNLTVSAGTINGLIFAANIMISPTHPIYILTQFISWINLDLGIETCFFNGMTAYDKVGLQFVFPLYIWLIIAIIIVLCRYSTWLSSKLDNNVVQVLATLVLLSYTKLFSTIILVIKGSYLINNEGKRKLVWYVDGNVDYLQEWQHIVLFIVAMVVLFVGILLTNALLYEPLIVKYLTRIHFCQKIWFKFKPFLDAFNGPYKDDCRFWTGLLLLARIVFVSVDSSSRSEAFYLAANIVTALLVILMACLGGVYRNRYLDWLEYWTLLNILLLSACSSAGYKKTGYAVTTTLLLFTFIGIISYHVALRLKQIKWICEINFREKIRSWITSRKRRKTVISSTDDIIVQKLITETVEEDCLRREPLIFSITINE